MRAVFLLAFAVLGCSSDPPKPVVVVKTATMAANINVVADGTNTTSQITILSGDTLMDHFVLGMGDTLTTTKGAASQPMAAMGMGPTLLYQTAFPGMDAEGTMVTVAFARTADMGAPNSNVALPAPVAISKPTDGQAFSRANADLVVNYAPSGTTDPMTWTISGTCVQVAGAQMITGDSGNFTIAHGGLKNAGAGGTCDAVVTVHRTRMGKLDPAFVKGGKVVAEQIGSITISSTP
jgi:hypothetical protein